MYPNYYQNTNRGFVVPFLLGGLAGGAAVGLTRPRPIYNVAPGASGNQNMPYTPGVPFYNSSYSYYQPIPRVYYY